MTTEELLARFPVPVPIRVDSSYTTRDAAYIAALPEIHAALIEAEGRAIRWVECPGRGWNLALPSGKVLIRVQTLSPEKWHLTGHGEGLLASPATIRAEIISRGFPPLPPGESQ